MSRHDDRYPVFEAVRYPAWREWYTRITWPDGTTSHSEPWKTEWAAQHLADLRRARWFRELSKRGETGNGDQCPLVPEHGNMYVLNEPKPPHQWCPNQWHDGKPGKDGWERSRAMWPLYGFEESVAAFMARLDQKVRTATIEELMALDTEVLNGNNA